MADGARGLLQRLIGACEAERDLMAADGQAPADSDADFAGAYDADLHCVLLM
jgi:hypothetical protein